MIQELHLNTDELKNVSKKMNENLWNVRFKCRSLQQVTIQSEDDIEVERRELSTLAAEGELAEGEFTEVDQRHTALEEQTRKLENGDNVLEDFCKAREDNDKAHKMCSRIRDEKRRAVLALKNEAEPNFYLACKENQRANDLNECSSNLDYHTRQTLKHTETAINTVKLTKALTRDLNRWVDILNNSNREIPEDVWKKFIKHKCFIDSLLKQHTDLINEHRQREQQRVNIGKPDKNIKSQCKTLNFVWKKYIKANKTWEEELSESISAHQKMKIFYEENDNVYTNFQTAFEHFEAALSESNSENGKKECSICLDKIRRRQIIMTWPGCSHPFHIKCVLEWFKVQSTCPLCRTPLA